MSHVVHALVVPGGPFVVVRGTDKEGKHREYSLRARPSDRDCMGTLMRARQELLHEMKKHHEKADWLAEVICEMNEQEGNS